MEDVTTDRPMSRAKLLRAIILLALPVLTENLLHILVGLTDTYLANHLQVESSSNPASLEVIRATNAAAGAAVGSITYISWFIGLIVSAIGTGSSAIIARAVGSRHRRIANKVCGQSVLIGIFAGIGLGIFAFLLSTPISHWLDLNSVAGLAPKSAAAFFAGYVKYLAWGAPFAVLMFTANSCLRGAGDTITPAIAMVVVDIVNVVVAVTLTYGFFGFRAMGFDGIAIGTTIAYITGGTLQMIVLLTGRGKVKLFKHRLRPDVTTMKRILRIGIPSGSEGLLMYLANVAVLRAVNGFGNISGTAHSISIRVESFSYMSGFAIATAVSTMVGHALGRKDPRHAKRVTFMGFSLGAAVMGMLGLSFILLGHHWTRLFSDDPAIRDQSATCLFITGWIQIGFAGAIIFSSALRGAGDTLTVMITNLTSILGIRLIGALLVVHFGGNLTHLWMVLAGELFIRGCMMFSRFMTGKWVYAKV